MILPLEIKEKSLNDETGSSDIHRRKIEALNCKMIDNFSNLTNGLPSPGEMFFLWTIKQFNMFSMIMAVLNTHAHIDFLALSSYNISRKSVMAFNELLSDKKIHQMEIFVSDVAKSMFPKSFETLNEVNSMQNSLSVHYAWNHSKIAVISADNNFYSLEGSGNFSYNARHEQYLLINSKEIYEFRYRNLISMSSGG